MAAEGGFSEYRAPLGPDVASNGDVWAYFDQYDLTPEESQARRPNVMDFEHRTLDERVNSDKYLSRLKGRTHRREERKNAEQPERQREVPSGAVFEEFLVDRLREAKWFGGEVFRTTEHDDWYNGVDAVVEWPSSEAGKPPVRLAIDFWTGERGDAADEKLSRLIGGAKVKYFRSLLEQDENGKPKEMRFWLPKVVIGADPEMFRQIAREGRATDEHHPLRTLLLEQAEKQIDLQLERMAGVYIEASWAEEFRHPESDTLRGKLKRAGESVDRIVEAFAESPEEAFRYVRTFKEHPYLDDLLRLKKVIDQEVTRAKQNAPLDEIWTRLAETSFTNNLLHEEQWALAS